MHSLVAKDIASLLGDQPAYAGKKKGLLGQVLNL